MTTLIHNIGKEKTSFLIEDGLISEFNPKEPPIDTQKIDAEENAVLPGFVDAHTHLVFSSNRAHEFNLRSQGKSYEEIHAAGGGILSTVQKTREASVEDLFEASLDYLKKAKSCGTTTMEIKSGYGLDLENELKILRVIKKLQEEKIVEVVPTFLGAHTIPEEHKPNPDKYIDLICQEMLPQVAREKLATFFDVFIEKGSFSVEQAEKICGVAINHGLKIRLHSDQFTNLGGTELGIKLKATSIDHLEKIDSKTIQSLSSSQTTATLLPGVAFFLGYSYPNARALIDSGVRVALASDFNPGSCMSYNLALIATIAITQMKMTVAEALSGITLNGAYSLGLQEKTGTLEVGKRADFLILNTQDPNMPFYHFGESHIKKSYSYLDFK